LGKEQFIVIDFRNEWDFISVFARNTAQYTLVATALQLLQSPV